MIQTFQAPGVYGKVDDENSLKLLNKALEIGCDFWDTAGEHMRTRSLIEIYGARTQFAYILRRCLRNGS
jgi:hypothetical protein